MKRLVLMAPLALALVACEGFNTDQGAGGINGGIKVIDVEKVPVTRIALVNGADVKSIDCIADRDIWPEGTPQ